MLDLRASLSRAARRVVAGLRYYGPRVINTALAFAVRKIRQSGLRHLQPWPALHFDRYLRQRQRQFGRSLVGLRCADDGEPGLVSIVLPVYNGAAFLEEALRSVQAQTYRRYELIAVDDGSTDGSGALLDAWAARDPRIRVVHQPNRKLAAALSHGVRLARGEYLTWLSADNRLRPEFLQRLVACLERHPDWEMTYADKDLIDEQGRPLRNSGWYVPYQRPPGSEHIALPTRTGVLNTVSNNFIGAAFLYRRRAAALLGDYSPHRFTVEDYDYWLLVNALLTLRHSDFSLPLYEYRFHSASLTAQSEALAIPQRMRELLLFDDFRRDFFLSTTLWVVTAGAAGGATAAALRKRARAAQQLVLSPAALAELALPCLFVPVTCVHIAGRGDPIPPPPRGPDSALRALVLCDRDRLDERTGPALAAWDVCLLMHRERGRADSPPPAVPGLLSVDSIQTLFLALDIRGRVRHTRLIEQAAADPAPSGLAFSIVVCTYRRGAELLRALESVARQSLPLNRYEVLVVNNDPSDRTLAGALAPLRRTWFREHPEHLRLIDCPLPGLCHARNAGLAAARSEYVYYLDDDARAEPAVLAELARAFAADPTAAVVGGRVEVACPAPRPAVFRPEWANLWSQFLPARATTYRAEHFCDYPFGANWAARRSALLAIGGFRQRYSRRGDNYDAGDEVVAAELIAQRGGSVVIVPSATVFHHVAAARFTYEHVRKTLRAVERTCYQVKRDLYLPMDVSIPGSSRRLREHVRRALRALPRPSTWTNRASRQALIDHLFGIECTAHLLAWQAQDLCARLRPPVA